MNNNNRRYKVWAPTLAEVEGYSTILCRNSALAAFYFLTSARSRGDCASFRGPVFVQELDVENDHPIERYEGRINNGAAAIVSLGLALEPEPEQGEA